MVAYPVHHVDKGLSVAPLERIYYIGCLATRENCPDKRRELILGNGAADQALQGLVTGVEGRGGIEGAFRMQCRIKTRRW